MSVALGPPPQLNIVSSDNGSLSKAATIAFSENTNSRFRDGCYLQMDLNRWKQVKLLISPRCLDEIALCLFKPQEHNLEIGCVIQVRGKHGCTLSCFARQIADTALPKHYLILGWVTASLYSVSKRRLGSRVISPISSSWRKIAAISSWKRETLRTPNGMAFGKMIRWT